MSIANRLNILERAAGGNDCRSCGYPLPGDRWPDSHWFIDRINAGLMAWQPIDLDNPEPMPAPHRCPTCGRAFNFFSITLGDRLEATP